MLQHSSASLYIRAVSAYELKSVQHLGKQDPYLQFSLDFSNKESFVKTFTHKNAGENAVWNQNFEVALQGEPDLFIEVRDEESTVDEVIGFCAIPINQVVHASGANINGIFEIFTVKGERAGWVNLHLAAQGFPNSQQPDFESEPIRGSSYINEEHAARVKSNNRKATGVAVGGALLGGAFAIGAGLLGKKLYDDHREEEEREEQERLAAEQEAQRLQEEDRRQREEFDEERARFEEEKREFESRSESTHNEYSEEHHHQRRHSNSDDEDDEARKWNPVGTYAAGDRVKYHGNVYICLQGHTSNPTWAPNYAHSLWQTE